MKSYIIFLVLMMQVFCAFASLRAEEIVDFQVLDTMPIQDGGRKKPFFVFAQETLLSLCGRTSLSFEGQSRPSNEVIGRIWLGDRDWKQVPMVLVDYLPVKAACGWDLERKLFSYEEITSNARFRELLDEVVARRNQGAGTALQGLLKEVSAIGLRLALLESLITGKAYRLVPSEGSTWGLISNSQPAFEGMRQALQLGNQREFDESAGELRTFVASAAPDKMPTPTLLTVETYYQKLHPFRWAWICYGAAAITLALTSSFHRKLGYRIGMTFAILGAVLLISGFCARVWISGRAPVTNMYESIIWVALGTVGFALLFEAIYRSRYFLLGASPFAVISLMIADAAPMKFDPSISPLVPVLQNNFWLTTHVLTITLSYAAFALALGVAHIALGKIVFVGQKPEAAIYHYIYRSMQVGVLLLAVGTLLGAVWANYSWGRFWDWDPKETWALIALLAYLFILHGRIAGKWGGFGIAVGAILGFQTIIMAWYGVNYVLGAGLHSYGFGNGSVGWAIIFVIVELLFVSFAIWKSANLEKRSARAMAQIPS